MSHLSREPAQNDTLLGPVLFRDGLDRRQGARIPMASRVRIGPPGGLPTSVVSASDLSLGGMFVDADREVRVGARFSVEVPLEDGTRVYVPEAEVAYNRQRSAGSGFGVRFVDLDEEAQKIIAKTIESATGFATDIVVRSSGTPVLSALPTIVPAAELAVSHYPEPPILEERLALDYPIDLEDERDDSRRTPGALTMVWGRWREAVREARVDVGEKARRTPKLFGGIAVVGTLSLAAAFVVMLWSGSSAQAVEPQTQQSRTVSSSTHQVLMGSAGVETLGAPTDIEQPEVTKPATKRNKLPPLVLVDPPAPPAKKTVEAPTPAVAAVAAPPKATAKPAAEVSAKAKSILNENSDRLVLHVDAGARVLKTHVFSSPARFVVDLVDQKCPVAEPKLSGNVRGVRSGRHPDFCRVVIDASQPIDAGRFTMRGGELVVDLHY